LLQCYFVKFQKLHRSLRKVTLQHSFRYFVAFPRIRDTKKYKEIQRIKNVPARKRTGNTRPVKTTRSKFYRLIAITRLMGYNKNNRTPSSKEFSVA
jgi:hypothetical protein